MNDARILIVEDDQTVGAMLKVMIQMVFSTYQVDLASGGRRALELFEAEPYDLVVADYMMPEMNGLQLYKALRRIAPQTEIIIISAADPSELNPLLIQAGVKYAIQKPFARSDICNMVGTILAAKDYS